MLETAPRPGKEVKVALRTTPSKLEPVRRLFVKVTDLTKYFHQAPISYDSEVQCKGSRTNSNTDGESCLLTGPSGIDNSPLKSSIAINTEEEDRMKGMKCQCFEAGCEGKRDHTTACLSCFQFPVYGIREKGIQTTSSDAPSLIQPEVVEGKKCEEVAIAGCLAGKSKGHY